MEHQANNSPLDNGERVTSTYAEIYFHDTYCKPKTCNALKYQKLPQKSTGEWISPSDLLIGIVKLEPPFTSKMARGKTHKGILEIGNAVLEKERSKLLNSFTTSLQDDDASWNYVLTYNKREVVKKVEDLFLNVYKSKSEIMQREMSNFYEHSLQNLEEHLRSELQSVLQSIHASIISHLNSEIQQKMQKEKKILIGILSKKHIIEVKKIASYYRLLLENEYYRNSTLLNKAFCERNDAVRAFYTQIEAERITSTMYVMSLERKKCQIKKMFLEQFQTTDITEKLQKLKYMEKQNKDLEKQDVTITSINKKWEQNIKKILQLFLKFISFSLKLLPEQTTFLLDLEKLVVLQLNEIHKNPYITSTILYEEEQVNLFEFPKSEQEISVCDKEPFVLVGDLSDPIPPRYGSRETLSSDVDLQFFRLERQYVYAKCHGYESIKKFLDAQICKCLEPKASILETKIFEPTLKSNPVLKENELSSTESLVMDDFLPLQECPVRKCNYWVKRNNFPYLAAYLDYSEENFNRVTSILGQRPEIKAPTKLISPKNIANSEPPFSETKELHRTVETQCSSQEDLTLIEIPCPCIGNTITKHAESHYVLKSASSQTPDEILLKRKISLQRLIDKNPDLLKIFTDECFDYKM